MQKLQPQRSQVQSKCLKGRKLQESMAFQMSTSFITPFLVKLFNDIILIGSVPNSWNTALVTSIHKKGSRVDPCNYRPISVLPTMARLFCSIIRQKLERQLSAGQKLSPNQIGNKKGYRTSDHITTLLTIMQKKKLQKRQFHVVFVDLKNAFDTVNHTILMRRLAELEVNPALVNVISNMYNRANFQLKVDNTTAGRKVPISNGVRQGRPLLPAAVWGIYRPTGCEAKRRLSQSYTYSG